MRRLWPARCTLCRDCASRAGYVVAEAGSREVERFGQAPARAVIPPERSAAGVAGEAGTEDIAEAA